VLALGLRTALDTNYESGRCRLRELDPIACWYRPKPQLVKLAQQVRPRANSSSKVPCPLRFKEDSLIFEPRGHLQKPNWHSSENMYRAVPIKQQENLGGMAVAELPANIA
jgi:hypothetical protein